MTRQERKRLRLAAKADFVAKQGLVTVNDAAAMFFPRELEVIEERLEMAKYPQLEFNTLLPNRRLLPVGSDKYTWRYADGNFRSVPMAGHEDGAPMVMLAAEEQSVGLTRQIAAYGWDQAELDAAQYLRRPLADDRAKILRDGFARNENELALLGDAATGLVAAAGTKGLYNMVGATVNVTPADGTASSRLFTAKSAAQVQRDLLSIIDAMPNSTLNIEGNSSVPLNMVMPHPMMRFVSTLMVANTSVPVMAVVKQMRPHVTFMGGQYLDTAGAGGLSRIVVYDPAQITLVGCMPFAQKPPEVKAYQWRINCYQYIGGCYTAYPKSIVYADGN